MNQLTKRMLAGAGGALLISISQANAASFSNNDLLLNFREVNAGVKGATDVTINLGNVAAFKAANLGLGSVNLNSYLAGTDLTTLFGGNLNGVFWTVVAADTVGSPDIVATRNRPSLGNPDLKNSTAFPSKGINQSSPANRIFSTGNNAFNTANGTAYGTYGATVSAGASSYSGLAGTTATGASANWGATVVFPNPGTEIGTAATGSFVSRGDLYEMDADAANNTAATYLGYFEFDSQGNFGFYSTLSVVPEPSTYGALAGFGLLALSLRGRFRKANA